MKKSFKTNNYGAFSRYEFNREVLNEANIKAIMNDMKEFGFDEWNPIIVSVSGKVADGQNRLEAARRLGKDVWVDQYDREFTVEEIRRMNLHRKNWDRLDFIHSEIDNEDCQRLYRFCKKCQDFGFTKTTSVRIALSSNHRDLADRTNATGINDKEEKIANDFFNDLKKLEGFVRNDIILKDGFIAALLRAKECSNFTLKKFIEKLDLDKISNRRDVAGFVEEIERVFNNHNRKPIEISRKGFRK